VGEYLDQCDLVLVMSVMPGFGGQEFDPVALEKLRWLRRRSDGEMLLSVDGGVNLDTIGQCAEAGANLFVMGTALLGQDDYAERLAHFRSLVKPH
jgi:ribulose-phosphate 3-epimerase